MANKHLCILLFPLFLVQVMRTQAKIPAIIVFGDSSVDAGNNNYIPTIARSNFSPYGRDFQGGRATGRFCNGRLTTDFISEYMGLKPIIPAYLDPAYSISDFAVGVSFASAATGYDNVTSDVLSVIPFWKQLEFYKSYRTRLNAYLGEAAASQRISESLHLISIGTNDFLENYYTVPGRASEYNIAQYETFLAGIAENFIRNLYSLGARKISVGGLPPMGCMPLERTTNLMDGNNCVEKYNNVAMDFNSKLYALVPKLNQQLAGLHLLFSNPYYILLHIIKNPSFYGFEVTSTACCATGMFEMGYACSQINMFTCTNADKYVFWDSFHPSQKTNQIIANYLVKRALYKMN